MLLFIYSLLMMLALALMASMILVKSKQIEHILFAIFCGSITMVSVQQLSEAISGPYHHLIGIGTCATCSVIWLIAITLFRGREHLQLHHYATSLAISTLVVMSHSIDFYDAMTLSNMAAVELLDNTIQQTSALLSSTVLVLTLWEALSGVRASTGVARQQRIVFAVGFSIGLLGCTVVANALVPAAERESAFPFLVAMSAMSIMLSTFIAMLLPQWQKPQTNNTQVACDEKPEFSSNPSSELFSRIETLLRDEQLFLNPDLKLRTIAQQFDVSDYKIGEAIRSHSDSSNFNQFINQYRIEHARVLLKADSPRKKTILEVSLDSGFASVAPFNRAFKALLNCTPNEYRKKVQTEKQQITN